MRIDILSIFTDSYFAPLQDSILKRAQEQNLISILYHNLRDYTTDFHKTVDDRPYGGGPGMVFKPEPLYKAIRDIAKDGCTMIMPSPEGTVLGQDTVKKLAVQPHLFFICGHYEGIDARISDLFPIEKISIGDYVITSGSLATMIIIDAVVRQIPGVVGCGESVEQDSFYSGLLDHPHYTRPAEFMGLKVPEVLLSGNHKEIEQWRFEQSQSLTKSKRPDLWLKYIRLQDDIQFKNKEK
ncbi:MAG: tRNA (guanosine(37)-N1)-methyltransferase TrmD [Candidatus Auribacterota bacterium]|jgi:tRNA (guanine37-N1)-methyltransferase|nr:tRNA (guanosine(37)-N1)-methyltransferase TrmD [Candidatus Auribacterota bacterium]